MFYRLSATGSLSVSFTLPAGAPPAFPVAARFTGSGLDEVLPVAGHNELRLRPFDATTDALTSRPQLDERIVAMYSVLHAMGLNADDVQAFCRLYTAIVDKAVDLLSGPGGLASFLRRRQLGVRLGGPSLPLDIGYAETIPAGIRNAVILRDKHCRWAGGCNQPASACEVHHVRHKANGGKTSTKDCVLLCFYHHQVVIHRWGWTLVLNPDGTTTAWNKDKTKVLHSHGPPARAG